MICLCSYCITDVGPERTTPPHIVPQCVLVAIPCGVKGRQIVKTFGHHEQIILQPQEIWKSSLDTLGHYKYIFFYIKVIFLNASEPSSNTSQCKCHGEELVYYLVPLVNAYPLLVRSNSVQDLYKSGNLVQWQTKMHDEYIYHPTKNILSSKSGAATFFKKMMERNLFHYGTSCQPFQSKGEKNVYRVELFVVFVTAKMMWYLRDSKICG